MKRYDVRVAGDLTNADLVTTNTFWVGVYPGLTQDHLTYIAETLSGFLADCRTLNSAL
jgi:CDP-6-deoxy-D-xylo-4-hexulose-3-dehydrase